MKKRISKKRFATLTVDDRRILSLVIARLELNQNDDVLEVFKGISPAENGFFDSVGCRVSVLSENTIPCNKERIRGVEGSIFSLRGGEFDLVFVYNFATHGTLAEVVDAAGRHIGENGRIVILNTLDVICVDSMATLSRPVQSADNCDKYSLIIL